MIQRTCPPLSPACLEDAIQVIGGHGHAFIPSDWRRTRFGPLKQQCDLQLFGLDLHALQCDAESRDSGPTHARCELELASCRPQTVYDHHLPGRGDRPELLEFSRCQSVATIDHLPQAKQEEADIESELVLLRQKLGCDTRLAVEFTCESPRGIVKHEIAHKSGILTCTIHLVARGLDGGAQHHTL